jgi:antitoxin component YwqK of YwqJK toxin-antitoxin module
MDGIQKRWHAGNVLAREALFKNGNVIYDIRYDKEGNVTQQIGIKQ